MNFRLLFNDDAKEQFHELESSKALKPAYKSVCKTLAFMETNLRHPSLHTHEFCSLKGPNGEKIFESYAQNETTGAYRVFWYYGHEKQEIPIIAIVPHS